ncbi:MAG: TonB family protein [Proteobacteria bacterium]|nr:TonB family protein [Pseudomonadota bacterium]
MIDRLFLFAVFLSSCIHGCFSLFFMVKPKEIPPKGAALIEVVWEEKKLSHESSSIQSRETKNPNRSTSYKSKKAETMPVSSGSMAYKNSTVMAKPQSDRSNPESIRKDWIASPPLVPHNDEMGNTSQSQVTERKKSSDVKLSSKLSTRKAHHPLPTYPWICRKRKQEGVVAVNIKSDGKGRVQEVTLHKSSGHAPLDTAALEALRSWIFAESFHNKVLSIIFRLKG